MSFPPSGFLAFARRQANEEWAVTIHIGLGLPGSCGSGTCGTRSAHAMEGSVHMDKNFTLEPWETEKGLVLSCQARPTSDALVVSDDER